MHICRDITIFLIVFITFSEGLHCGDGVCQGTETRQNCYYDCYYQTPVPKKNRLTGRFVPSADTFCSPYLNDVGGVSGVPVSSDTLGKLVSYRFLTELPGASNFAHGFNIFSGRSTAPLLFEFLYCNNSFSTVQDSYRNKIYYLPEQVEATPFPYCTFAMQTSSYSSASELALSMTTSTGVQAALSVEGKKAGFSAAIHAAYSGESTVNSAQDQSANVSGTTFVTTAKCTAFSIQMRQETLKNSLHIIFQEKIRNATLSELKQVISEYGTFYFTSGDLGGSLTQVISTSASASSSMSSSEIENSAQASFGATASGWGVSASASGQYSTSMTADSQSQNEFDHSSSKSDLIVKGGAPGSFGPSGSDSPSTWGDWAGTVDLIPVPIDFQLQRIHDLIDQEWKNPRGQSIAELWAQAEEQYYNEYVETLENVREQQQYKITFFSTFQSSWNYGPYYATLYGDIATSNPRQMLYHLLPRPEIVTYEFNGMNAYDITHPRVGNINSITLFDDPDSFPLSNFKPTLILVTDRVQGTQYYFPNLGDFGTSHSAVPQHPGNVLVLSWTKNITTTVPEFTAIITTSKHSLAFIIDWDSSQQQHFVYPLTERAGVLISISFLSVTPIHGSIKSLEIAEYFTTPQQGSVSYEYISCGEAPNPLIDIPLKKVSLVSITTAGTC